MYSCQKLYEHKIYFIFLFFYLPLVVKHFLNGEMLTQIKSLINLSMALAFIWCHFYKFPFHSKKNNNNNNNDNKHNNMGWSVYFIYANVMLFFQKYQKFLISVIVSNILLKSEWKSTATTMQFTIFAFLSLSYLLLLMFFFAITTIYDNEYSECE